MSSGRQGRKRTIGPVAAIKVARELMNEPSDNESRAGDNGGSGDNGGYGHDRSRPVYHISIVAEMVETHPQTLRMYERMGLLAPRRTRNNIRLYSEADVEQVRRIQHLTQDLGVNLAGVEVVFKLLREMHRMRAEIESEMQAIRTQIEREIEADLRRRTRSG